MRHFSSRRAKGRVRGTCFRNSSERLCEGYCKLLADKELIRARRVACMWAVVWIGRSVEWATTDQLAKASMSASGGRQCSVAGVRGNTQIST